MSATTRARNVGADALPVVGPAQIRLADCVARDSASVPEVVIGEPDTDRIEDGAERATLVTVPVPPMIIGTPSSNVPAGRFGGCPFISAGMTLYEGSPDIGRF